MGKWSRSLASILFVCVIAEIGTMSVAQSHPGGVQADGTVVIDDLPVPISNLLSPEAHAYMLHLLVDKPFAGGPKESDIKALRAFQDEIMNGFLRPMRATYPVKIDHKTIAGVYTDIVTPSDGISPQNIGKVLLNLHGGGFITGARAAGLVESIPIASIERIRVITIDYRMYPEFLFPAASEDVAAVYTEILKEYSPEHVGLYGCSAGGLLTGMSVAWFQKHNLPNPAAVGVLCSGLGDMFVGDSQIIGGALNGMSGSMAPQRGGVARRPTFGYIRDANPQDPLLYPLNSSRLLAKFPPTLFVTSTRGFEFSSVLDADNALVRQGVETELHVWDGLPHAFWYNSQLPESKEVYDVISRFFDAHLSQ